MYQDDLNRRSRYNTLKMNKDDRGSFTELIHTLNCGQVSINLIRDQRMYQDDLNRRSRYNTSQ